MDNTTNTTPVTLESIAQKKAMLLQENISRKKS